MYLQSYNGAGIAGGLSRLRPDEFLGNELAMKSRTLGYSLISATLTFCFVAALHAQSIAENPAAAGPGFTITGTTVNVVDGADTGNVSAITVTPINGFTGSVTLTAAVTSAPANSQLLPPPTFGFGTTSPVVITGTTAKSGSMAVTTTPFLWPTCTNIGATSFGVGGAALACLLFFGIPAPGRKWRGISLLVLLAAVSTGILACGSGSRVGCVVPAVVRGGTAPGTYTITVTGTSGDTTATGIVTLNVTQNKQPGT